LAAWGIVLVAGLLFLVANGRYISNFINGPYAMSGEELERIQDPRSAPRYFVRVGGTQKWHSGIQEISTETKGGREVRRSVSADYYFVLVGNHILIVKSSSDPLKGVEGTLEPISASLDSMIFNKPELKALHDHFYPFYLNGDSFREPGYWGIGIGLIILILLVIFAVPAWKRLQNLHTHPVVRRVASWGDPITLSMEIKREHESRPLLRQGRVTMSDHYIFDVNFFRFNVTRFVDLLWAYKSVTRRTVYFIIPAGKEVSAVMHFYGDSITVGGKEKDIDYLLTCTASKAPWAVFGYSKEIENLFKKNTREFCAAVEAHKNSPSQDNA
jgi:hypothetical protein